MDDCEQILRELEPYLDKELSPEAWQSVHAHINGCLDCLHIFDFHAELRMVISKKCQQDALPPGLLARIQECFGDVDLDEADEVGGQGAGGATGPIIGDPGLA